MSGKGALPHSIFVTVLTLAVAALQWFGFPPLLRLEMAAQDSLARLGSKAPLDPSLVFLACDTASAQLETATDLDRMLHLEEADAPSQRALRLMAHEWPWSREVHALVLDRLIAAGARAVVFDFTFPKPSPDDDALRASLDRHRGRVVIAGNIADDGGLPTFCGPTPTLIPETAPRDARIGFDNFALDLDDVVRRAQYRWAVEHGVWSGSEELSLAARALDRAGLSGLIPEDRAPRRLRFAGLPGTFAPRSIFEIFAPAYWRQNYDAGKFFKDKIVIIGASGNWQHDEHATPMGLMPGAELHLNAINALMHAAFVREMPRWAEVALVCLAGLVSGLVRKAVRRPYVRFLMLLAGAAVWFGAVIVAYNHLSVFLPALAPLLAFQLHGISGLFHDVVAERREKAQLRRTLERYVSRNVVEELLDQPEALNRALGGELRPVTVLFSDVRNFTRLAAIVDSRALVAQLNEYLSAMVKCVFDFGGTLDKFIGDAVMAVWGNVRSAGPAEDARAAVACALAMREELARLNARWEADGKPTLRIGIGLNAGEVIAGNIGSPSRMEFTVIGDAVNIAWRLQEHTKRADSDLLLGENLIALLGDEFPVELLGDYRMNEQLTVRYGRLAGLSVEDRSEASIHPAEATTC